MTRAEILKALNHAVGADPDAPAVFDHFVLNNAFKISDSQKATVTLIASDTSPSENIYELKVEDL